MELVKKYSNEVIKKALNHKFKFQRRTNTKILLLCYATNSEKRFYKITYIIQFEQFICECQKYQHTGYCSHILGAIRHIRGKEKFWEETQKTKLKN